MSSYFLKRLLMLVPTLLLVTIAVFIIMRLVPGDPVSMMLGDIENPELVRQMRAELRLDDPVIIQYLDWLADVVTLNFGVSFVTGEPVIGTMLSRLAVTAQIVTISVLLASCLALVFGTLAAWRANRRADLVISVLAIGSMSVPAFWVGIALIIVFGIKLQWLPTVGYVSPLDNFSESLQFLVLPIMALVVAETGGLLRMVRATTLDVLSKDYITAARARGLSERSVLFRHALPNTLIPTATLVGFTLGSLLGGAAVIESVFTLPGMGRLLVESVYARDYVMVQGVMIFVAIIYVLVNLLVDMLYPVLDPRVRLRA
ncbi:MAG: ABC transporter permease [Pseudomonadota bacterium]